MPPRLFGGEIFFSFLPNVFPPNFVIRNVEFAKERRMKPTELTDETLMKRIAAGDATAFQALLDRYGQKIYACAWRLTSDRTEAEDMAQEVFLKVWRHAEKWTPDAKLSTWLYRILYNHYIDTLRRARPTENTVPETASTAPSPEQSMLQKAEEEEIKEAINALPARQKEALILCYHQGLKAKEAADILSVSVGALESLLFRARQTLKERLSVRKETA